MEPNIKSVITLARYLAAVWKLHQHQEQTYRTSEVFFTSFLNVCFSAPTPNRGILRDRSLWFESKADITDRRESQDDENKLQIIL